MSDKQPTEPKLESIKELRLPTAVLGLAQKNESTLLAACLDGGIYEVNVETGVSEFIGKHESYASGVVLPASSVVSAGYDGQLRWWDASKKELVRKVQAHRFWSWQLAASPNGQLVASVSGQYLCGGYKYEPAPSPEPTVKVYRGDGSALVREFDLLPPVLSVAFSPDSNYVAAANMMGDVRVWEVETGRLAAQWNTPSFTSWGIIKSHHYIGGVFALAFSPDGNELLLAGMGPMRDPMAGNGKQTWQRWQWRLEPPQKRDEIKEGEHGNGLMETILFQPSGQFFLMAGRLAQGKWNTALFHSGSGALATSLDAKMRVTRAAFNKTGDRLYLAGAVGQEKKKDGKHSDFGRIRVYKVENLAA